ncbi:glycosyltransferase family 4 protein [Microbacterium sp. ARD31]|uniref:glycosyltransferase family 4 protein n=1 Tax=Microbacterium sp. ARD31 TaxID=2962576 RepID=UPI00288298F2|nr:glycosyltransferase family 4 protein [Microbacterium sp. ARD31]MDT0186471.1 glycosyltransferase family 4 protein [Microbacterium sp. ARD31]
MSDSIILINNSRETFTSDRSGAIATCLWELCRAADRVGVQPHVISRRGEGFAYDWPALTWLPPLVSRRGVRETVERMQRRATGWARHDQRAYAKQVAAHLRHVQPRIVVVNNDPEVAVYLRRAFPETRIVHWFHNLEVAGDRFRRRIVLDGQLEMVAVSDYLARAVETVYGLASLRVATARNGVDSDRIRPGDHPSPAPVIGYLGRLAVEKGVDVLLSACALLVERGAGPFSLQLVGDTNWGYSDGGSYARKIASAIDGLEARGVSVSRVGHVARDQIPDALRGVDIHVVPSRWDDPMPLTVLEGMAAGLAVVASSSGGIPEVLWDVGRLVPRDDVGALASVLHGLLQDATERERLGRAARARAEELTWDATWTDLTGATR